MTEETAGRRLEGQEEADDRAALGDCLETSMIDATLVTRDATMMAPGCFRPGAKGAGARASAKGTALPLEMHDQSNTDADTDADTGGDTEDADSGAASEARTSPSPSD